MPLSEGSKVRLQLEADFLNSLAGNVAVLGTVGPWIAYIFGAPLSVDGNLAVGLSFVCFALALALHLLGAIRLKKLDLT